MARCHTFLAPAQTRVGARGVVVVVQKAAVSRAAKADEEHSSLEQGCKSRLHADSKMKLGVRQLAAETHARARELRVACRNPTWCSWPSFTASSHADDCGASATRWSNDFNDIQAVGFLLKFNKSAWE